MTNAYRYFEVKLQCTPACTMLMHLLNEWKDVTNITKAHFIATMVGGKASFFLNIRVTFSLLIAGPLIASSQFAKAKFFDFILAVTFRIISYIIVNNKEKGFQGIVVVFRMC